MDNELEKRIQQRVLAAQQDDFLNAFFLAFHSNDEEGMKRAIDQLRDLDQRYGTHWVEKLSSFLDKISWIQQQPNREAAAQIVSAVDMKAFFESEKGGG